MVNSEAQADIIMDLKSQVLASQLYNMIKMVIINCTKQK